MILNTQIRVRGLNSFMRKHWSVASAYKKICYAEVRRCIIPRNRKKMKKYVTVIHYYKSGKFDKDNFVGGCKYIIDALVQYGILYDDTEEWVEVKYHQEKDDHFHCDIAVSD